MRRILLLLSLLLAGATATASAQARARLAIVLDSTGKQPRIQLSNVADDPRWREAVESGVALRIQFTLEVWKEGSNFLSRSRIVGAPTVWSYTFRYRRTLAEYQSIFERTGYFMEPQTDSTLAGLERKIFGKPLAPQGLTPTERGTYYYSVQVEWSTLSSKDLDEISRFQGNPSPGVMDRFNQLLNQLSIPGGKLSSAQTTNFKIP